ncbi:putative lipopolysaccharide heptosyltransferase III [Candidatus Pseudothioglobus singularis]|nr:putative lipopolysaccharide heptosyltransferase III [Candidatus Pseudothioglobus singularis]
MKILLLKFRNIGDVLLTTPLVKNIKNSYPNALIDFAVNKGTEHMITLNPNLNKIITYNREDIRSLPFLKRIWREIQFVRSFKKENYDLVINLTDGDRGDIISWYSQALIRVGYKSKKSFFKKGITHEMPDQGLRHTIEVALDSVRLLNLPVTEKKVEIFWSKEDEKTLRKKISINDNFAHIHPVSRWRFKCISDSIMAELIDFIEIELGIKAVITASDDIFEIQKVDSILNQTTSSPINLSGKLSLKQTACLNKKAKFFVGVDTSIMHISASNNVPVLAFFGPSGAFHWGPWDNGLMESEYIKLSGMQTMGIHKVFSEERSCQPCGLDGCNGSKVSDCLMTLDISKIKKDIQEIFLEQNN